MLPLRVCKTTWRAWQRMPPPPSWEEKDWIKRMGSLGTGPCCECSKEPTQLGYLGSHPVPSRAWTWLSPFSASLSLVVPCFRSIITLLGSRCSFLLTTEIPSSSQGLPWVPGSCTNGRWTSIATDTETWLQLSSSQPSLPWSFLLPEPSLHLSLGPQ